MFVVLNDITAASETILEHSFGLASLALPIQGTLYLLLPWTIVLMMHTMTTLVL